MKVYVINGIGGSGKDFFMKECSQMINVHQYSTIDIVKLMLQSVGLFKGNLDSKGRWVYEEKDSKTRNLLANVKESLGLIPVEDILNRITFDHIHHTKGAIFICTRHTEEIDIFKEKLNCKTIWIANSRVKICDTEERFLDDYKYQYDFYIHNNGTIDKYRDEIKNFLIVEDLITSQGFII